MEVIGNIETNEKTIIIQSDAKNILTEKNLQGSTFQKLERRKLKIKIFQKNLETLNLAEI